MLCRIGLNTSFKPPRYFGATARYISNNIGTGKQRDGSFNLQQQSQNVVLNETGEEDAEHLTQRLTKFMNRITEYEPVEEAKKQVAVADETFLQSRERLKQFNSEYDASIASKSAIQQHINTLLYRKQDWTSADLQQFTTYCQKELESDRMMKESKENYLQAEKRMDQTHNDYINALRKHYNEEQIWTEKSRRIGVYFSAGLFIVNSLLFGASIAVIEPRRRRKIVEQVTEKLDEMKATHLLQPNHPQLESQPTANESISTHSESRSAKRAIEKPEMHRQLIALTARFDHLEQMITDLSSVAQGSAASQQIERVSEMEPAQSREEEGRHRDSTSTPDRRQQLVGGSMFSAVSIASVVLLLCFQ